MSVPVLPDTAPFSPAQRAWLNGFLAGLVGATSPAAPAHAPAAPPQPEEDLPWHDPALPLADRLKLAEGKPPARQFMAAMAQLDCGACGYLCKTYGQAIAAGAEKDLTRCTPGGKDTAKKLKELIVLHPPAAAPAAPASRSAPGTIDRANPFPARLVRTLRLNSPASAKDTRLIVFDIKNSSLRYKPGDALGIFPENCPELVEHILQRLSASGAEDVPGTHSPHTSLYEALHHEYSITRPSDDMLRLLAGDADHDALDSLEILDLLDRFPRSRPDPASFVAALLPLQPRLYSISSSPTAHPHQVHLTVGVVRYQNAAGRACNGVASTFLAQRVRPGQKVRVFVHPSTRFSLPADPARPIIMIGPGTGIAPFRAFLHERKALGATGRTWLFFGDQRHDHDFLYRDELEAFRADGTLTRLDTAFSRDQAAKLYVQDRLRENAAELFDWLQAGAHLYVCGDATRMAADVARALQDIIAAQGRLSPDQAAAYIERLTHENRYQRDVY